MPDVRRHRSRRVGAPSKVRRYSNSCAAQSDLALLLQHRGDGVAQFEQHLHVQRGVVQPVRRQRSLGPVGRAVSLLQAAGRAAARTIAARFTRSIAGQPAGQLGVVELRSAACRSRPGTAGPDRRRAAPTRRWPAPRRPAPASASGSAPWLTGSISTVPAPVAADLHQIGAVGVAEARRPFGIDRERAVPGCQKLCGPGDFVRRDRQRRHPVGRRQQRGGFGFCGVRWLGSAGVGVGHLRRGCATSDRSPRQAAGPRRARAPRRTPRTCGPSSSVVAVQDARSSSWWARGGPEMSP